HLSYGYLPQTGNVVSASTSPNNSSGVALSLVIPLYNEAALFDQLESRLLSVLRLLPASTEVLLVDDGSTDGTGMRISEICQRDARFIGVQLSRNFGHQMAV